MDYTLEIAGAGSRQPSVLSTKFYPFSRNFFTPFEQELDSVILDSNYAPKKTEPMKTVDHPRPEDIPNADKTNKFIHINANTTDNTNSGVSHLHGMSTSQVIDLILIASSSNGNPSTISPTHCKHILF